MDFERRDKFCFIRRPCFWGMPKDMQKKALKMASLSIMAPVGNLEGACLVGTL